jgi:hypothetical protein
MLHTAEPDPVIGTDVHHYAKSLRWGDERAIYGLPTERKSWRSSPEECGAGRKIGPFSLRLPGIRYRVIIS